MTYDAVFEELRKRGDRFTLTELLEVLYRFGLGSDAIRYYIEKGWLRYEGGRYIVSR